MSTVDSWLRSEADWEPSVWNVETPDLQIRIEQQDGESFLALYGELDLTSAATLDRELNRAIDATPTVIVDLSALQFIDSSGLRSVAIAARRADAMGQNLRFLRPPSDVAHVLAVSGVDDLLRFLD